MPRNSQKIDYSGGFPEGGGNLIEAPRVGANKKNYFGELVFIALSLLLCGV